MSREVLKDPQTARQRPKKELLMLEFAVRSGRKGLLALTLPITDAHGKLFKKP